MNSKGCALIGLPTYYDRFGFKNYAQLIHEGVPQEIFVAKAFFYGIVPSGTVEFHQAFKQLSFIEKDAIADVIIQSPKFFWIRKIYITEFFIKK